MINKITLAQALKACAVNFNIEIKDEYIDFIHKVLDQEGFSDEDVNMALTTIMRTNKTMYGAMPSLAMLIEARPERVNRSTLPEHQRITFEKPKELEKQLTPEQQRELRERTRRNLAKLNAKVSKDREERERVKKELLDWAKNINNALNDKKRFGETNLYRK